MISVPTTRVSRRQALAGAASALLLTSCLDRKVGGLVPRDRKRHGHELTDEPGRLRARPRHSEVGTSPPGLQPIALEAGRDGLVYVPAGYRPDRPAPMVLMLHGAGGNALGGLDPLVRLADEAGLILLAPDSRGRNWDLIVGGYGPDVAFIDRALAQAFARYAVDEQRIAVEGFSDGASYALSLGMVNGDLFSHVIAFSPGFAARGTTQGSPDFFISHGIRDPVLPIDSSSRRIVPRLRRAGYVVRYQEFDGGHVVPPEVALQAVTWFVNGGG
ncbi:MAG: phospholipase [Actinomycetota bacterium]|nr:phospholipase [Actinomycetota bacterium]